ncbi:GRP family sugar transporter [Oscillatoria amoena NRMC-F 0135]|nr:GRP family sugar transporter [Oscillatoria amoena NRMC-F 0135]
MMEGIGWSVLTVLAWGIWLVPTQRCRTTDHLLIAVYVTLGNLLAAIVVATMVGAGELRLRTSIHPFLGGIVWAVSGWCAFAAVRQLGTAKAMGIWSPLNIVVSMLWGAVLFSEFANSTTDALLVTAAATGLMVAGIVTIISAGSGASAEASERGRMRWLGLLPALGAGLLWGSYFIPIRVAEVSLWVAALPMAMGMFVGSTVGAALMRRTLRPAAWADLPRLMLAGVLWAAATTDRCE